MEVYQSQCADQFWTVFLGVGRFGCGFCRFVERDLGSRTSWTEIWVHELIGVNLNLKNNN